jgi:SAM-dependent methyltransferase
VPRGDPIVRPCWACGRVVAHSQLFRVNGYDIRQCCNCGLGSAEAHGFDPAGYYTDDYFEGRRADGYAGYLIAEPILRREFARTVDFIRRYRGSGRLLEIGCAYGFFLSEASRHFDVSGIELAEKAVEHARSIGLRVLRGTADEANLRRAGLLDVIVLLDVIEHLPNPRETLALCREYLNPRGIIIMTTGDFGSGLAKLTGSRWRLMTPPQHLWFFTRKSMRRLAGDLGMLVERIDHPWKIVPASLIVFQFQRMLGLHPVQFSVPNNIGVPVNLFDAMRIVLRKT